MSEAPPCADELTFTKLHNILGEEQAYLLILEILDGLKLKTIESPSDRLLFANELIKRRGLFAVVGHSVKVLALLQGAKEGSDEEELGESLGKAA